MRRFSPFLALALLTDLAGCPTVVPAQTVAPSHASYEERRAAFDVEETRVAQDYAKHAQMVAQEAAVLAQADEKITAAAEREAKAMRQAHGHR